MTHFHTPEPFCYTFNVKVAMSVVLLNFKSLHQNLIATIKA